MGHRNRTDASEAVRITSLPESRSEDIAHRQKRYVVSMLIRTGCFVAAIIVGPALGIHWLMWILIAASFFLPYIAVVMANGASPRIEGPPVEGPGLSHPELPRPRTGEQ